MVAPAAGRLGMCKAPFGGLFFLGSFELFSLSAVRSEVVTDQLLRTLFWNIYYHTHIKNPGQVFEGRHYYCPSTGSLKQAAAYPVENLSTLFTNIRRFSFTLFAVHQFAGDERYYKQDRKYHQILGIADYKGVPRLGEQKVEQQHRHNR